MIARVIEGRVRRPGLRDDIDPFLALFVAFLVGVHFHARHIEFVLVPAADDVEPEPACADLVGGDHLFGGNDGIEQRHVNGAECHDVFSGGQDSRCPGQGFQAAAIMVGFAAIPFPATEREQEIEPCFVRHFCGGEIL